MFGHEINVEKLLLDAIAGFGKGLIMEKLKVFAAEVGIPNDLKLLPLLE